MRGVEVADPAKRMAGQLDAESAEPGHGGRHQTFAARLVDGTGPGLDDCDLQSCSRAENRRGQPGGTASDDQRVDHAGWATASALVSQRSRTESRTAVRMVNTDAVIRAEPGRGRAKPSPTTAE